MKNPAPSPSTIRQVAAGQTAATWVAEFVGSTSPVTQYRPSDPRTMTDPPSGTRPNSTLPPDIMPARTLPVPTPTTRAMANMPVAVCPSPSTCSPIRVIAEVARLARNQKNASPNAARNNGRPW